MTLDINQPTDQALVSTWPAWVRASRAAISALTAGTGLGVTNLTVAGGSTSLSVGVDLLSVGHEVVIITGSGLSTLATILGGVDGQIKTFIFQDNNIDITDGVKSDGEFYLDQLPALSNFTPEQDDILCLVNIGGDGASVYGYWKELYRTISVK